MGLKLGFERSYRPYGCHGPRKKCLVIKTYKQRLIELAKIARANSDKLALPVSESEIQEKLSDLSEATTSTPQSSLHKQSLHNSFKKTKKKKLKAST